MALNINGTTGISGVDGSASAPALQGTDSNTGINFASDTVNINTGGATRATVDNSGNLGLGTTTPTYKNAVFGGSQRTIHLTGTAAPQLRIQSSTSGQADLFLQAGNSGANAIIGNAADNGDILFSTHNGTSQGTRATILDDGNLLVGRTNTINVDGKVCNHVFEQLGSTNFALGIHCNQSTKRGLGIYYTSGGTGSDFLFCEEAGTAKFEMKGNGGFANFQSNDVNLSDISMKKNITDASSTINEVKQWKIREFHLTDDEDSADKRFGVIAQEIETIDSKVVTDYSTNLKGVKEQQIYWKAIKSLQEAIAKIEVLEAKVAALEAG